MREPAALPLPLLIASQGEAGEAGRGVRRGINCTHSPHASRLLRPKGVPKLPQGDVRAVSGCRESAPGPGHGRGGPPPCGDVPSRAWAGRLFSQERPRGSQAASGRPAARCTRWRAPALRLRSFSTKAARLTKAGSQLPACQDRKLIELLNSYPTSKPNQLRGLLSE